MEAPCFSSGRRVKGLERPAGAKRRGHGPLTRRERPNAPGRGQTRKRSAPPAAPLTTEGDSLPSLARGGGEWWERSDL